MSGAILGSAQTLREGSLLKVTSIKQQAKRIDRYSVFVDERYAFSLSESALLRAGLASGQELDPKQLQDYKQLSADDKLYIRAMHYAAIRLRSEWEMRSYMQRKDAPEALIEQTIERLADFGLINDEAYAVSFVRDRQLLRPTSRRKLQMELRKRRVSDTHINNALASDELIEVDSLQQVIAKKRRQTKYQDPGKLMQYLARQGFNYSDIKAALAGPES